MQGCSSCSLALAMALLHLSLSSNTASSSPFCSFKNQSLVDPASIVRFSAAGHSSKNGNILKSRSTRAFTTVIVRSTSETAAAAVGQVTEVNKDTFWPIVEAAGGKTVVLDMYTQWCGPCKVMAPKFQELSQKYLDVVFLKLDCNEENKPLAKELGIRAVPTFKILKEGKVVKEVTGAKLGDLVLAIETVESS